MGKAPKVQEVDPAVAGAIAMLAAFPGVAEANQGSLGPGPLAGTAACTTTPIKWFVYPFCDSVFWVSPIYMTPVVIGFFAAIVTAIQLVLPATQPDEDLRA